MSEKKYVGRGLYRVRTAVPDVDDYAASKTERQWRNAGYAPKEGAEGEEMWCNQFCQDTALYYCPCDIRPATDEEKAVWRAENKAEKEKRAEARRKEWERMEREEQERRERWEEEQREWERKEQERQAAARPFYDEIIASGKKFAPVYVSDPHPLGESYGYYTYIVSGNIPAGTAVTVPFGEDNTPMSGVVGEGEYSFEDLRDMPWFPFGMKYEGGSE